MSVPDCMFCKIPQGEMDAQILHQDQHLYVIRDINPQAPVHLLIIPLEHQESLASVTPAQEVVMGHIFLVAREMAQREGVTQSGYRLVLNQGPDAGQAVDHTHVHLLGGKRLPGLG